MKHGAVIGLTLFFILHCKGFNAGQVCNNGFSLRLGQRRANDNGRPVYRRIDDQFLLIVCTQGVVQAMFGCDAHFERGYLLHTADPVRPIDDDVPFLIHGFTLSCPAVPARGAAFDFLPIIIV